MDKKLIEKMIKNCFKQYYEPEAAPIGPHDLQVLAKRILKAKEEEPAADIYELVNDVVYEFLTK